MYLYTKMQQQTRTPSIRQTSTPLCGLLDLQMQSTEKAAVVLCSPMSWHLKLLVQPPSREAWRTWDVQVIPMEPLKQSELWQAVQLLSTSSLTHFGTTVHILLLHNSGCCLTMLPCTNTWLADGVGYSRCWSMLTLLRPSASIAESSSHFQAAVGAHRFLCPPRLGGRGFPS